MVHLEIVIHHEGTQFTTRIERAASETVLAILQVALGRAGLPASSAWVVRFEGRTLAMGLQLSQAIPNILGRSRVLLEVLICPRTPAAAGTQKDTFETDIKIPAMEEESGSQAVALNDTDLDSSDFDLAMEIDSMSDVDLMQEPEPELESAEEEELEAATIPVPKATRMVERQATVRYYSRMNPQEVYPLLVVLSEKKIAKIHQNGVDQRSASIKVEKGTMVEIEPILPGCTCYPSKRLIPADADKVKVAFWVVPHVLGEVRGAFIELRQRGREEPLTEIPLEIKVVKKTFVILMGLASVGFPFLSALLKHFHLDFETQLQVVFERYGWWLFDSYSVPLFTGFLLLGTAAAYLSTRPRKRDFFWDISPVVDGEGRGTLSAVSRVLRTASSFAFRGAILAGVTAMTLVGVIAARTTFDCALSWVPMMLGGATLFGAVAGAIIGGVEGSDDKGGR